MKMKPHQELAKHFEHLHNNPYPPLNPEYDPRAKNWSLEATQSMEQEGFYDTHSREECAIEWRRRFDFLKQSAGAN